MRIRFFLFFLFLNKNMGNKIWNVLLGSVMLLNVWCSTNNIRLNDKSNLVVEDISKKVNKTLDKDSSSSNKIILTKKDIEEKNNLTKKLIWFNEYKYFIDIFGLNSKIELVKKVYSIQKNNWLKKDWVIWEDTLKVIYLNYYKNINNLPFWIAKRLEVYNDMEWYKKHKWRGTRYWKIFPWNVPNIFSKHYYYWIGKSENLEDSYVNKDLISLVNENIDRKNTTAVIYNRSWNFFLAVYVKWELELLTYISPWTDVIKWWMKTLTWNFKTTFSDKYHISWAKNSIKDTNNWLIWAVMPYALHITGWIYAHAWYVNWQRKSHWCIRLPIYYAKWLYDIFKKNWNIEWFIFDN